MFVYLFVHMRLLEHSVCGRGGLRAYTGKPLHPLCVLISVHTPEHAFISVCTHVCVFCFSASFPSSEETPMVSMYCRASVYLHSPDSRPAVCQMSRMYVSYVKMCISYLCACVFVCVYKLKPIHLFPPWSACLRYGDTSVAPGSADVGANAARLFTLNHVSSRQTPCCRCSYGLVSSIY